MIKINRNIDEQKMESSKEKSINFVMNEINSTSKNWSFAIFTKFRVASVLSVLVIAIVTLLSINPFEDTIIDPPVPVVLTTFEGDRLAELSYISGRLIASSFVLDNQSSLMKVSNSYNNGSLLDLTNDETTEFENNIDEFNTYFDMMKVFLEEDSFSETIEIIPIIEGDYDTSISFLVDGKLYTFLLTVIGTDITGELTINSQVLVVVGSYFENETELKLELTATNGADYIKIEYKTENEDEIEKKYEIEQYIAGVLSNKEIKVTIEANEQKVEISENEDEYELKREVEDTGVVWKLSYEINDLEGEVEILESVDNLGFTIYTYKISEGDKYKEIDLDDPDEEDEDKKEKEKDQDEDEDEDSEDSEESDDLINPYFEKRLIKSL